MVWYVGSPEVPKSLEARILRKSAEQQTIARKTGVNNLISA
jgi:hypothetical protein